MNVEIGAEAAQFPEKEYINGIDLAVYPRKPYGATNLVFKSVLRDSSEIYFTV
jgi:hypothetical protein